MTSMLAQAWAALGGESADLTRVHPVDGPPVLPSALPVAQMAQAAVACVGLAATDPGTSVLVDPVRVAAAYNSDRHLRIDGRAPDVWAAMSGFWPTGDGWVRTHANYPHHRRALLTALDLPDDSDPGLEVQRLSDRLLMMTAEEVELRAASVAAIAVAVRTEREWQQHPAAQAPPLISVSSITGQSVGPLTPVEHVAAPLAGIKVVDLTRVIAGPVASRTLALLGATVLRVDSPNLPEVGWQHLDTGMGKRSTRLDLHQRHDREAFFALLADADVLLTGYRPGALARFGLDPDDLATSHPDLTVASLSAWGTSGPWRERRGFDSIVQATTGISMLESPQTSPDNWRPGALPAQALDHSAGYLLAAAIVLAIRVKAGRPAVDPPRITTSLLAMSHWLRSQPRPNQDVGDGSDGDSSDGHGNDLDGCDGDSGNLGHSGDASAAVNVRSGVSYALPAVQFEGGPDDYAEVGRRWGIDPPRWW